MLYNYQYRLKPNTEQKLVFNNWLRVCRYWYNRQLGQRFDYGNFSYWATRMGRHPEMDSLRASLLKKQKGKCTYCGLYIRNGDIQETDHIIAKKLNGKNVYSNYQLLHGHCHDKKTASDIKLINAARSLQKTNSNTFE